MSDLRHIDPAIGILSGEGAQMDVDMPRHPAARRHEGEADVHTRARGEPRSGTYYDLPVVKPPPWRWYVPAYFYFGGVAGVSAAVGAAGQLAGPELRPLVVRSRWLGLASIGAGTILLVADLGRPMRAMSMLRVFRPTSALNMGGWIIGASGTALLVAAPLSTGSVGTRRLGDAAGLFAGAVGVVLATYTGAVLSNTAIPVWRESRRTLPFLFAASAAASAASALQLIGGDGSAAAVIQRLSVVGKAGELIAAELVERELGRGRAGRPIHSGRSGWLWTAGKALGAASLVASLLPGRSRRAIVASGLLGTAAGVVLRLALHDAGIASGRDPRATLAARRSNAAEPTPGTRTGA